MGILFYPQLGQCLQFYTLATLSGSYPDQSFCNAFLVNDWMLSRLSVLRFVNVSFIPLKWVWMLLVEKWASYHVAFSQQLHWSIHAWYCNNMWDKGCSSFNMLNNIVFPIHPVHQKLSCACYRGFAMQSVRLAGLIHWYEVWPQSVEFTYSV